MRFVHAILALAGAVAAQTDTLASVKAAFEDAGIVGDVIPAFDPQVLLTVSFPGTGAFAAGTLLTPAQARQRPTFAIPAALGAGKTFLVAEVDPDAPTPQNPSSAQIRHFLAPDFVLAAGSGATTLVNGTRALSDYRGPSPPAGSDPHRYTILLFEQAHAGVTPPPDFNAGNIAGFDIQHFVDEVNAAGTNTLTLVGGTFFRSQTV
ncbi:PEBP-like protein [Auricularia subglabra TFB-10046 SS5]|nr:PEBP-like protein [Auricularia subglabra TFB-10046 SS5]